MGAKKKKYYVVWSGKKPGVYLTWPECEAAIHGVSKAKYKAFESLDAAEKALAEGPSAYWGIKKIVPSLSAAELERIGQPIVESICVDAAWNAQTKVMEYRGVWYHDRSIIFEQGPYEKATNNIGEFLAIVHALALMQQREIDWPIYTDSRTAISWVRKKKAKSKSMAKGETSPKINDLVGRAERWLQANQYVNEVLKWATKAWGEIPADYGRK